MQQLKGLPVVKALEEQFKKEIKSLSEYGIIPKLSIVRVGEKEEDLAYERGILKRFHNVNALVEVVTLPNDVSQIELEDILIHLNKDIQVHGILLFRPLPNHLSEDKVKDIIDSRKDVDCMSMLNLAHVFAGNEEGYPPCTSQAVMELLSHYHIPLTGKKVTLIGRSLVVGKPLSMLLLKQNATVTICHTKTSNLTEECKRADILIACAGSPKMVTSDHVHSDQIIIDVGINVVDGILCGDVDYETVAPLVNAVTPVPGGVGTVTTSVLLKHTIKSALSIIKPL